MGAGDPPAPDMIGDNMDVPSWADRDFSQTISKLREAGEGQKLEFKKEFPPQLHELCKEVASFATSGGGRILLGVADEGTLVGLPCIDAVERDALARRAQGSVGGVRPTVNAAFVVGIEDGKVVLCIEIAEKQNEPVFYYDHRPYVRDRSVSRPATPDEVKTFVWSHPSAEHQRFMEKAKENLVTQSQESSRRFDEDIHELRRNASRRISGS
jgi:predicted HTH transcriptional regulator